MTTTATKQERNLKDCPDIPMGTASEQQGRPHVPDPWNEGSDTRIVGDLTGFTPGQLKYIDSMVEGRLGDFEKRIDEGFDKRLTHLEQSVVKALRANALRANALRDNDVPPGGVAWGAVAGGAKQAKMDVDLDDDLHRRAESLNRAAKEVFDGLAQAILRRKIDRAERDQSEREQRARTTEVVSPRALLACLVDAYYNQGRFLTIGQVRSVFEQHSVKSWAQAVLGIAAT